MQPRSIIDDEYQRFHENVSHDGKPISKIHDDLQMREISSFIG